MKQLLHKAETATSRRVYLEKVGPSVSVPQHQKSLSEAREREKEAWEEFKELARREN